MPASTATPSAIGFPFNTGDIVKIVTTAGNYRRYTGKTATVRLCFTERVYGRDALFANLLVHDGSEQGMEIKDVPVAYLRAAPSATEKPKRRSPLNLHEVQDKHTEAEKQADAQKWLTERGYLILASGQFRSAAVCWDCTREHKAQASGRGEDPNKIKPVKVLCIHHNHPVYSPDTGNTEGLPDWLVTRADWPRLVAAPIEWKRGAKAHRRPAQVALADQGRSVFVDSLASCLMALYTFEAADPRITPHSEIIAWLRERRLLEEVTA
jgi:hypothetical protein